MNAHVSRLVLATLAVSGSLAVTSVQAAACKSLEQQACATEAACTWVDAYQRTDGRTVKAHCRSTPRKRDPLDLAVSAPQQGGNSR